MRLLVVTPTLGRSDFLAETIASIAATAPNVIHLTVAPASSHAALEAKHVGIALHDDPGDGMYAALNAGLEAGSRHEWDWFTYLNDDDVWNPFGMRAAIKAAETESADVLFGRVRLITENGASAGELPIVRQPQNLPILLHRGIIPLAQPGTLYRRSLVEELGGFDASFRAAGDLDLIVRAVVAGARIAHVPHVVAAFRLRADQLSKNEAMVAAEKRRAIQPLQTLPPTGSLSALLRFRVSNLGVYLDRLWRHGWASMDEVYRKT